MNDMWMYKYAPGYAPVFSSFLSWTGIADHPRLPHTIVLYNARVTEHVGEGVAAGSVFPTVLFDVYKSRLTLRDGLAIDVQCRVRARSVLNKLAVADRELVDGATPAAGEGAYTLCKHDALAFELFDHFSMRDLALYSHCIEFVDSIPCFDAIGGTPTEDQDPGTPIPSLYFFADIGRFVWENPDDDREVHVLDVDIEPAFIVDGEDSASSSEDLASSVASFDSF